MGRMTTRRGVLRASTAIIVVSGSIVVGIVVGTISVRVMVTVSGTAVCSTRSVVMVSL